MRIPADDFLNLSLWRSFKEDIPAKWAEPQLILSEISNFNSIITQSLASADFSGDFCCQARRAPIQPWRIVAIMPVEKPEGQNAQTHVIFLENFFDELRRKVPVGK